MTILETFFDDFASSPCYATTHSPSFVVKVVQNDKNASTFGTQSVFDDGDLDVVECDECCPGCGRVASLNRLGLDTFTGLDENNSKTVLGLASNGEAENPSDKHVTSQIH